MEPVLRRRDLLATGVTADELRRSLRTGELVVVRRGAYATPDALPDEPEARHAVAATAAAGGLPGTVVSHVSAAALHGIALWDVPLRRVHLTRDRRSGARTCADLVLHAAALAPDEVVELGGVRVTSLARTVADLARTLPFAHAVVVADSALRSVTPDDLATAVARAAHRPGNPRARRVVTFADGRSESPGESRSRVALRDAGLPAPALQDVVRTAGGAPVARVDFRWRGVVGEFDGRVKYGRLLRPGVTPGDAVFAEKRREDAIRDTGLRVVRWTWADLDRFGPVAERIRAYL